MAWTVFYVRPLDPAKSNRPIATKFCMEYIFIVEMCSWGFFREISSFPGLTVMQQVAKEGFLFVSILNSSSKTDYSNSDWERRWFKLHTDATLFCHESFSGKLLMTYALKSLNMLHGEIEWPSSVEDKPFVISLRLRERDQTILLEADCKVCMESWASQLTRYLPTEYTTESSLTYETMESYVRERRYENASAPDKTGQSSGSEEYSYVVNDFSKHPSIGGEEDFPPKMQDPFPKSKTLDRRIPKGKKGIQNEYLIGDSKIQTHPSDKKNRTLSLHNYYAMEDGSKLTGPKFVSNEAENYYETPESFFLSGNLLMTDCRSGRKSIESNLGPMGKDCHDLKAIRRSSSFSEDQAFLASVPHYQELLVNNWLMCFILPNEKVYTQLIDVTLPIESSLKLLLECFTYSHPSLNSCLSLKIIGDLHQTFSRTDTKKDFQSSLSWGFTFRSQGVIESKILQISVIENKDVKLDLELLENFLYRVHHLPVNEMFSLSWVSFVKGNFPELDVSVSARHSACIYLIYSRMQGSEKLDVKKFIPSPLEKLPVHLQAVSQNIENYAFYKASSLCEVFLNEVNASLTGNAISLIAKKVIILKRKIKYYPCILTICKQHIGIVRPDIASHYDKPDMFSNLYHCQDIQSWLLNEPLDVVAIKLTENKDDDWTKFKIVKTNAMKTVDLLFRDFFQIAKYYNKSVDLV